MVRMSVVKKQILIAVVIAAILACNFFQGEVRGFFYGMSWPVQKVLGDAGLKASIFFDTLLGRETLRKEAELLRLQNLQLKFQNYDLRELKLENQLLREALEIGLEKDFQLYLGNVTGKDVSQDFILIDAGSRQGIREGMPVITQQKVLVGRISHVFEEFSKVMLISHPETFFEVEIFGRSTFGIIQGKKNGAIFLDLIPQEAVIQEGDFLVTTASLEGKLPGGLLVGQISRVIKTDVKPFQQAEIDSFFDIADLRQIFIITNFQ